MKVAIIGAGIAGAAALKTLLTQDQEGIIDQIDVFDYRDQLGVGSPYSKDSKHLLMNSYVGDLGFEWDEPGRYRTWLEKNYPEYAKVDIFSPRPVFGEYLQEYFADYYADERVVTHQVEITQMQVKDKRMYMLSDTEGTSYGPYPSIFMCLGHPPYADYYDLIGKEGYVHDPYPVEQVLGKLSSDQSIGIIGSGLTGIDIMRYLQYEKEISADKPVTFYILNHPFSTPKFERYSGELVFNLDKEWIEKNKSEKGLLTLEQIVNQFRQDMIDNGVNLDLLVSQYSQGSISEGLLALNQRNPQLSKLQYYGRKLTAFLPDLNMALSGQERVLFFRDFIGQFEHFRSQTPAESIEFILDKIKSQQLRIVSGLKDIIVDNKGGFKIITRPGARYHSDVLINATGFDQNLVTAADHQPLVKQLFADGLIEANPLGGILIEWPNAQVINQHYGVLDHCYLTGHWIFKTQFGNNNTKLTYRQAEACALHFLNTYNF